MSIDRILSNKIRNLYKGGYDISQVRFWQVDGGEVLKCIELAAILESDDSEWNLDCSYCIHFNEVFAEGLVARAFPSIMNCAFRHEVGMRPVTCSDFQPANRYRRGVDNV